MPVYDDDALSCACCGEGLRRGIGFMGRLKYPAKRVILLIAIAAVLLSFIALIVI